MTSNDSAVTTVRQWQAALSREDQAEVLRLSDPDIEIVGPRGSARGAEVLRQWLTHTRVTLEPRQWFARGEAVVVAQGAVWRSPETGEEIGRAEVASVFRVRGGRLAFYARHDGLDEALASAGLTRADTRESA